MYEKQYQTYYGWKRAIKSYHAKNLPNTILTFEGDKDICNAMTTTGLFVGEWDGNKGVIYNQSELVKQN